MRGNQPADVLLLLLLAVLLLLVQQAASAVHAYSGRVVISYGRGDVDVGSAHHRALMRRRLENEVAPELMSSSGWTAGLRGGSEYIGYNAMKPSRPVCGASCAAPGDRYTPSRGCESKYQCRQPARN